MCSDIILLMDDVTFEVEQGSQREQALVTLHEKGFSDEEGTELIDQSVGIARKMLGKPENPFRNHEVRHVLPLLIASKLGPSFNREERRQIVEAFPTGGKLSEGTYTTPELQALMQRFSVGMQEVMVAFVTRFQQLRSQSQS